MKKIISKLVIIVVSFICFYSIISINAHSRFLDVTYDECKQEDEIWYYLNNYKPEVKPNEQKYTAYIHLSQDTKTIKYYVQDYDRYDPETTWSTLTSISYSNEIKEAFINSMKKWNNVYYYSYDANGNRIENKVINIVEGTEDDHNFLISPSKLGDTFAKTGYYDKVEETIEIKDNVRHWHCKEWSCRIDTKYYYDVCKTKEELDIIKERNGMHEVGHILGLHDVDKCCDSSKDHHEEVLMGYGKILNRATDVTYKDIAGVSITRGFHTDNDHVWMLRTNQDNTQDVICAQCNGIRKNVIIINNTYGGKPLRAYNSCTHKGRWK